MDDIDEDEVFARLVPRRVSKWILPLIGVEFAKNCLAAGVTALEDVVTVLSQAFADEQERIAITNEVIGDIERIDDFLALQGEGGDDAGTE